MKRNTFIAIAMLFTIFGFTVAGIHSKLTDTKILGSFCKK